MMSLKQFMESFDKKDSCSLIFDAYIHYKTGVILKNRRPGAMMRSKIKERIENKLPVTKPPLQPIYDKEYRKVLVWLANL